MVQAHLLTDVTGVQLCIRRGHGEGVMVKGSWHLCSLAQGSWHLCSLAQGSWRLLIEVAGV